MKPWRQGDRPAMHSSYTTYKVTMSGHARVVQRWRQPTLMHSVQRRRAQVDMRGLLCGATRERLLTGKLRRRWRNFQVPRGPDRRIIQCNSGRGRVGAERAARACGWHRWWLRSEFFYCFIFFPFLFRLFFLSCFSFAFFFLCFSPETSRLPRKLVAACSFVFGVAPHGGCSVDIVEVVRKTIPKISGLGQRAWKHLRVGWNVRKVSASCKAA